MPRNAKHTLERINLAIGAWETLRPDKSIGGVSLKQFKDGLKPSLEARDALQKLQNQTLAAQNKRNEADAASQQLLQRIVNTIKGDPSEGDDGDLYEAMGYKRRSERKSGLTRKNLQNSGPN